MMFRPIVRYFEDVNNQSSADFQIEFNSDKYRDFIDVLNEYERLRNSTVIVSQSFLNSTVSAFDAFLADLIFLVISARPDMLSASDRSVTFAQLSEFVSLDEAKDYFAEKQVEDVLRTSHSDQFDWLEKRLDVPLRKDLEVWPDFVEATERRNLFAHTGGKVSRQYLFNTLKAKYEFADKPVIGQKLDAEPEYLNKIFSVFLEIGIKLGHVAWRKIRPEERAIADKAMIEITYDLMIIGEYELVRKLLEFFINAPKIGGEMKESDKLACMMNLCSCYRELGQKNSIIKQLDKIDWNAKDTRFQLANAVHRCDWATAAKYMEKMDTKDIRKEDYRVWPLFKEFRKTEEFKVAFRAKFRIDFDSYLIEAAQEEYLRISTGSEPLQVSDNADH